MTVDKANLIGQALELAAADATLTPHFIAGQVGLDPRTVSLWLRRTGIRPMPPPRPELDDLIAEYETNPRSKLNDLAKKYGTYAHKVIDELDRRGIPQRKGGVPEPGGFRSHVTAAVQRYVDEPWTRKLVIEVEGGCTRLHVAAQARNQPTRGGRNPSRAARATVDEARERVRVAARPKSERSTTAQKRWKEWNEWRTANKNTGTPTGPELVAWLRTYDWQPNTIRHAISDLTGHYHDLNEPFVAAKHSDVEEHLKWATQDVRLAMRRRPLSLPDRDDLAAGVHAAPGAHPMAVWCRMVLHVVQAAPVIRVGDLDALRKVPFAIQDSCVVLDLPSAPVVMTRPARPLSGVEVFADPAAAIIWLHETWRRNDVPETSRRRVWLRAAAHRAKASLPTAGHRCSEPEMIRICAWLDQRWVNWFMHQLFREVMYGANCRYADLAKVRAPTGMGRPDVCFIGDHLQIYFPERKNGPHTVGIRRANPDDPADPAEGVRSWLQIRAPLPGWLFPAWRDLLNPPPSGRFDRPIDYGSQLRSDRLLGERRGNYIRPHGWRRAGISDASAFGDQPAGIAARIGTKRVASLKPYLQLRHKFTDIGRRLGI